MAANPSVEALIAKAQQRSIRYLPAAVLRDVDRLLDARVTFADIAEWLRQEYPWVRHLHVDTYSQYRRTKQGKA